MRRGVLGACAVATLVALGSRAEAYSVLTHQAAIDAAWDSNIRPLLLRRYPRSSADDLLRARSFAYGGSVIQDIGYYPFGSHFFSNLLHYVRSGDFVTALIRESHDVDEYAFALGALAHYTNDMTGHPLAVNKAVPMTFEKLRQKYGPEVTYVEAPAQHVIVEFSFDVVQAAGGKYLPDAYRQFIGFRVATDVLERAFRDTYGLELGDVLTNEDRAIGTFRYAVSQLVPALTNAAWRDKRDEIEKLTPGVEQKSFVFTYRKSDYEREYGRDYQKPGWFARFAGFVYRLVPKIGPLKPLSFKAPSADVNALFTSSVREANARFRTALTNIAAGRTDFRNVDVDTGVQSKHGEYALADDTYAQLLDRLADGDGEQDVPVALRRNIAAFYGPSPAPSSASHQDRKHWKDTMKALAQVTQQPGVTRAAGR
jgi:hypothetical protein